MLIDTGALLGRLAGDEAIGFFVPGIAGAHSARAAFVPMEQIVKSPSVRSDEPLVNHDRVRDAIRQRPKRWAGHPAPSPAPPRVPIEWTMMDGATPPSGMTATRTSTEPAGSDGPEAGYQEVEIAGPPVNGSRES